MNRPDTLAEVARRVERDEQQFEFALSEFLDSFYVGPARRQAALDDEPLLLADPIRNALLAAVGEHLARRWNLTIPGWTNLPERFLKRPYFTTSLEGLKALLIVESPIAFRRRLIFTEAEPLRRARMPQDAPTAARLTGTPR